MLRSVTLAILLVMIAGADDAAPQSDVAKRRIGEASALVLDRNLDERDVQLLTDSELDLSPANLNVDDVVYAKSPSPAFPTRLVEPGRSEARYQYWVRSDTLPTRYHLRDLAVAPALPAPEIELDLSNPMFPVARVPKFKAPDGHNALSYFEFDTVATFDSPNLWRYPNLKPTNLSLLESLGGERFDNLTGRAGLAFDVFRGAQRMTDGRETAVRFPFRATAMRLPDTWAGLTYDEMERHALALGYGLSTQDVIAEVHRYGRHAYVWASDTETRPPLDTFRAGLGECAAVNALLGTLLELNGVRYRLVAGFDPKFRVIEPSGGHSAIEVFDPQARQWSYVDAYTDVLLPGVSAAALAEGRVAAASTPMVQVVAPHMRGLFGEVVPLGRLFRYRVYADTLTRLQHISMLRMNATPVGEQGYGLGWTLNVAEPREASELFPERLTIHVRARYVVAGARTVRPLEQPAQALESSEQPAASPWGAAQFEIAPRAIMAAYPAPQRASKPNICEVLKAEAKPLIGPFRSEGNIAYWVESPVRDAGDSLAAPRRSPLVVCEDGQPLGPAHSVHEQIMTQGRGRFSHWGGTLYFSASDNSDPNRNGRSYHVVMPNP